jgi:23S rRNA (guanosine2251-2'-O)-methyltransferase
VGEPGGVVPGQVTVTLFGKVAVLAALVDPHVDVELVLVARGAAGLDGIVAAADRAGVPCRRVAPAKVTRLSGHGRHDQGVAATVRAPGVRPLDRWLADRGGRPAAVVVLDGVTNPANVGMIVRTVTAAGLEGTVVPRLGTPGVGPLVVKASAGVALRAPTLGCRTAAEGLAALADAGFTVYGLRAGGGHGLFATELAERAAFVLGNESDGVSPAAAAGVGRWLSIPLAGGVESLNVAAAAAVLAYEVARRRMTAGRPGPVGDGVPGSSR